jgi:hypothetical protein
MKSDRGTVVFGLVGVLVIILVCCICLVALVGAAAVLFPFLTRTAEPSLAQEPAAAALPSPMTTPMPSGERYAPVPAEAEEMEAALAQAVVLVADPIELAERLGGETDIPRVLAVSAVPIQIGARDTFWVNNDENGEYFQVEAEMVYETPHVYFWVESGVGYDLGEVRRLVDTFEEQIYPTNREFFGSEWTPGVDGDAHIYILFAEGMGSWVAGYYGSNDSFSPQVHEYSNGHEMFYISAEGQSLRDPFLYGVLAHEFQHMIHWNQDANEDNWLDEGLADLAAYLNGYDVGGWDVSFVQSPDIPLTFWPSGSDAGIHYGQAFLFLEYFLERFGHEATQALVADPANGLASMDDVLAQLGAYDPETGQPISAKDVFRDWAVAQLLLDDSVGDGRYALEDYPPAEPLEPAEVYNTCPMGPESLEVNQFGIDAVLIRCRGDHVVQFEGQTQVRLLPDDPRSGDWALWSNRGNQSDMTLTRSFDLGGVTGPIEMAFWVWYDIEEDWDYVYLEASTDGGQTWEILRTTSSTASNPMGSSYGWAYTGFSGGGEQARWMEERADLSGYAGEQLLVRFEYVTDASINGNGLLVDDIAVPAIGYSEDFEEADGGWEAAGFVRVYNRLPQTYRIVLVERGDQTQVREVALDETNRGQITFSLGSEYDEAVLIMIATNPYSWQPASYTVSVDR